ncbi:hypothetical protein M758_9G087400 [Ceratodon purpureus]|nr:hypothetical protein M758_9G087400 [Ceratodon purpureus]
MAPELKPGLGHGWGTNQPGFAWRGFQVENIRWEWPNPKGEGLQKLMPHEQIAGMMNAVGNAAQNGHKAWDGLVQQGIRSTKMCKLELPRVWGGKGREVPSRDEEQVEPTRAAAVPTSFVSSISTLQAATNANAVNAAENGSQEMEQVETHFRFPEQFRMPEVNSGGAVTKEDLGRATWTFLHTLAAQYPENPTRQQKRDAKDLMSIMTRLYPCKTCAEHFKEVLKAYPVKADSGVELAQWMCQVHNVVNRSLGKSQFPCQRVDARWGELHCDEGACDLEGRLLYR